MYKLDIKRNQIGASQGRSQGEGGNPRAPETENFFVEKWCYFRRRYS